MMRSLRLFAAAPKKSIWTKYKNQKRSFFGFYLLITTAARINTPRNPHEDCLVGLLNKPRHPYNSTEYSYNDNKRRTNCDCEETYCHAFAHFLTGTTAITNSPTSYWNSIVHKHNRSRRYRRFYRNIRHSCILPKPHGFNFSQVKKLNISRNNRVFTTMNAFQLRVAQNIALKKKPRIKKIITEEKKLAREAFQVYKALKKGYRVENIPFIDRKAHEKVVSKAKNSARYLKHEEY